MWLEHYLLEHPDENGFFCVSTSYRNEPDPVPGRHDRIFPMFEFELKGGMDELRKMEGELLDYLGFRERKMEHSHPMIMIMYVRHMVLMLKLVNLKMNMKNV